jgi:hypothetical protein
MSNVGCTGELYGNFDLGNYRFECLRTVACTPSPHVRKIFVFNRIGGIPVLS